MRIRRCGWPPDGASVGKTTGCPWDEWVLIFAAECGLRSNLEWAWDNGCPMMSDVKYRTMQSQRLGIPVTHTNTNLPHPPIPSSRLFTVSPLPVIYVFGFSCSRWTLVLKQPVPPRIKKGLLIYFLQSALPTYKVRS